MFAKILSALRPFVFAVLASFGAIASVAAAPPWASVVVHNDSLGIAQTSLVTITFSEAVTDFTLADMTAQNATLSNLATSNNITFTAILTPNAGVSDTSNIIVLDNTGVVNAFLTPGVGIDVSNNYAIDTNRPVATLVMSKTSLKADETSLLTVTFSEAVTGFTNSDLTIPNGTLTALSSFDGGITWTATYTPNANVLNASNVITLNNTGISDLAGNAGVGTTNSGNFSLNTVRPTATIALSSTALRIGSTCFVTIYFSEPVSGFNNADLTIGNGTLSSLSSADGGMTWTAILNPALNIEQSSNRITLDNTGVQNFAGNAGSGTSDSGNYSVDTRRPTATVVLAQTTLQPSDSTQVVFTFSEAVTGLPSPTSSVRTQRSRACRPRMAAEPGRPRLPLRLALRVQTTP